MCLAHARAGRTFSPQLDKPGSPRAAVLSYSLWQRRYGGDPGILGQAIDIEGVPRTVVGIMPASFAYPTDTDVWLSARYQVPEHPLRPEVDQSDLRDTHYFDVVGRLKPGVSTAKAESEANIIIARLRKQYGKTEESAAAFVVPLREDLVGETRPALLVLLAAVGLLLAIACANVANMLLARGSSRQKEIAIRAALGAPRATLVRQFVTESILLAVAGGGLGILLAYVGVAPLRTLLPADVAAAVPPQIDSTVLVFTAGLSIACGILFGLFPGLNLTKDLNSALKEGGRGSGAGARANRTRSILIICEVALAAVLLTGAALLIRSFERLLATPPGFHPERVLTMQLSLPQARYAKPEDRARFAKETLDRIGNLPGVSSAAIVSRLPLGGGNSRRGFDIKGRPPIEGEMPPDYLVITPEYFSSMGIRLLEGRAFTEHDGTNGPSVVIINQATANKFWPRQNPIGQLVTVGGCAKDEKDWCEVVGVVADVRQHTLDKAPVPAVYVPYARDPWPFLAFVVRTTTEPKSAAVAVQQAIHSIDKDEAVYGVRTMQQVVDASLSTRRTRMMLLGLFALLAVVLACVGIYGVMAYSVAQHAREIGIRIALGAEKNDVLRLVIGRAITLCGVGVIIGIGLAAALSQFMAGMLYGVAPMDIPAFAATSALLIATALLASAVPCLQATKVDPVVSLRVE